MADRLSDYSDSLVQETISDMASTFFGARRAVENACDHLRQRAEELQQTADATRKLSSVLHALLLDDETAARLYKKLSIDAQALQQWIDPDKAVLSMKTPKALTAKSRYGKLLGKVYKQLFQSMDEYENGRIVVDASGKKSLTASYSNLMQRIEDLNTKITEINQCSGPSCVLSKIREFDVAEMQKQKVTEAVLDNYAESMDEELKLDTFDAGLFALPEPVSLPAPKKVGDAVRSFGRGLYKERSRECKAILQNLSE